MKYEIVPILDTDFMKMRDVLNEYDEQGYDLVAVVKCNSTLPGKASDTVDAWVFKKKALTFSKNPLTS